MVINMFLAKNYIGIGSKKKKQLNFRNEKSRARVSRPNLTSGMGSRGKGSPLGRSRPESPTNKITPKIRDAFEKMNKLLNFTKRKPF
jgi:hypothetical protein